MNASVTVSALGLTALLTALLAAGCAAGTASRQMAKPDSASCPFNQQYVCTVQSASRTKNEADTEEFCRCERIEQIR